MAIHRRLDSFSLIFYLLLILWVKTELHQSLPPITSGFQLLRSLSANKYFCWTSRAVETLYLSWFFLVDPIISLAPVPATAIFIWFPPCFVFLLWAIPHNSKCRYGERGAATAKPKAQIILDVLSSILATQMPCRSRRSGA